jgi:oligoendopeptidase F
MIRKLVPLVLAATGFLAAPALALERSEVPAKFKWDLTALYPSETAWQNAKAAAAKRIPEAARFQGHLGDSSGTLVKALDTISYIDRDLTRLVTYASMVTDEDTRISRHLAMRESASQLQVDFRSTISYLRPEILALGAGKVRSFVASDPRLGKFAHNLDDILRYGPHTLSREEEKIAAQSGTMSSAGETIRDLFTNAELPYPEVVLSSGKKVKIDQAGYTQYRALPDRNDRIKVFRAFWAKHRDFQGMLGAALNAQTRAHVFDRDVHKYTSCVEAALFRDNIPVRVYTQLIADVNANLPTLHRYLRLRKRMMGVDTLRYEDLYAPIVKNVDLKYTPEQAMTLTLEAVKPLGGDYVSTLRKAFTGGWMDWMPTTGKAGGAYSTGAYGVHPYQLMNFTGIYEEVSTLAHESGHSMHTYLADQHQPYPTHDYAIFVAEVASTLNENLLIHHVLDTTQDPTTRLFLLGSYLDNLRGTLFRQVMFAEFELRIHELAEKGETLTGENMTKLYLELVRKYYGHAKGVCRVDDLYGVEWAYIDHFFYDFYVYQYATSIVASTAIANGIRQEAGHATQHRDAYLAMLSSGSSKYPIDLLKGAGVDMTTSAPFKAAMKEMNSVMDEMEKLLAEK